MDLVSSFVMLITSWLAARPSIYKYPVVCHVIPESLRPKLMAFQGRTRIETIGVILFCALMTTVAVQLLIESARTLGTGKTESEELHLIPIIFVCVASESQSKSQRAIANG
jgi:divalent metal cation (Fe/Co/Zn/Cd) transporter